MTTRNRSWRVLSVALVGLGLGGCEFISPIEGNPNAVAEASMDQLFIGAQVNAIFFAEGQLSRLSSMWTQQMTGVDRQFLALDNYTLTESDADDDFERIYTQGGLIDIRSAIALAEAAGRAPYAGILKIHEAFLIGMAASYWGDIPYSEAAAGVASPVLDDQAAVYAAVQTLLDDAIADLAGAGAGPGTVDLWFGGNVTRWTAVARTLKARFHMHMAEVDNARYALARTEAQAGILPAAGPAGNWKAQHSTAATENNLWYQFFRDRSGYIGGGDFLGPQMVADSDPRLPLYFSLEGGSYVFVTDVRSLLADPGVGQSNYDFPIVTCAENQFIIAEVEARIGTAAAARTAAAEALDCSEAEHGLAGTALDAQAANINTLTGTPLLNEIMRQKYIAMFLNPEALNDYKRSCQPGFTPRAGGVPRRLYYGQQERQTNTNVPDVGDQPLANDNDPNPCP